MKQQTLWVGEDDFLFPILFEGELLGQTEFGDEFDTVTQTLYQAGDDQFLVYEEHIWRYNPNNWHTHQSLIRVSSTDLTTGAYRRLGQACGIFAP